MSPPSKSALARSGHHAGVRSGRLLTDSGRAPKNFSRRFHAAQSGSIMGTNGARRQFDGPSN